MKIDCPNCGEPIDEISYNDEEPEKAFDPIVAGGGQLVQLTPFDLRTGTVEPCGCELYLVRNGLKTCVRS